MEKGGKSFNNWDDRLRMRMCKRYRRRKDDVKNNSESDDRMVWYRIRIDCLMTNTSEKNNRQKERGSNKIFE